MHSNKEKIIMAMVTKNEYGMVAVNNMVLCKMILDEMISMEKFLIPCNKHGKPLKKGLFTGLNDMLAAVDISEYNTDVFVRVYFISKFGESITEISNNHFDRIDDDFELLCLDKPHEIHANIKGVMSDRISGRELEVTRHND